MEAAARARARPGRTRWEQVDHGAVRVEPCVRGGGPRHAGQVRGFAEAGEEAVSVQAGEGLGGEEEVLVELGGVEDGGVEIEGVVGLWARRSFSTCACTTRENALRGTGAAGKEGE